MDKKYIINRFPICATVYAAIANKIGYNLDESYSLGLTRSIFFAAAKSGFRGAKKTKKYYPGKKCEEGTTNIRKTEPIIDQVNFAGLPTTVIYDKEETRGTMGGEIQTPEMFKKNVIDKFERRIGPGAFDKCWNKIKEKIKDFSNIELNSKSAYDIYCQLRDELREERIYK